MEQHITHNTKSNEFNIHEWLQPTAHQPELNLIHKINAEKPFFHQNGRDRTKNELVNDIENVVLQIEERQLDLTQTYQDWLKLGFALSEGLGEDGRNFFHRISRFHNNYDPKECDLQYTNCLKGKRLGVTISSFFKAAKDAGIKINSGANGSISLEEPAPAFPVEIFPESIQDFIRTAAEAINCPPDFIAVPMLAVLGTAIGNSREVQIKKGWHEKPIIFSAIVGEPGTTKTPALEKATFPIQKMQAQYKSEHQNNLRLYENACSHYEMKLQQWKSEPANRNKDATPPEKPERPLMQQIKTNDCTVEALAQLLLNNPGGILYEQDELAAWVKSMNQYRSGGGSDVEKWLSFWSGADVTINRKNLSDALHLENPIISVTGCIQPDVLDSLSGKKNNGFVDRILFGYPDPIPLKFTDTEIPEGLSQSYWEVFNRIHQLSPEVDENSKQSPLPVPLSPEAYALFGQWLNNTHLPENGSSDLPYYLKGTWSKLRGYTARFALIIECLEYGVHNSKLEEISKTSMGKAIRLCNYFKGMARNVHNQLHSSVLDKRIETSIRWLQNHGNQATLRDFYVNRVAQCKNKNQATKLIDEMMDRDLGVFEERTPPHGGRKSMIFRLTHLSSNAPLPPQHL